MSPYSAKSATLSIRAVDADSTGPARGSLRDPHAAFHAAVHDAPPHGLQPSNSACFSASSSFLTRIRSLP
jgi:hypothetical protein